MQLLKRAQAVAVACMNAAKHKAADMSASMVADCSFVTALGVRMQIPMGEGLAVTPGVVAVRSNGASTIALAARMQWAF